MAWLRHSLVLVTWCLLIGVGVAVVFFYVPDKVMQGGDPQCPMCRQKVEQTMKVFS
jgi:hypothetical protein